MTLFDWRQSQLTEKEAPLAARMRPRTLDEFFGQEEIIGRGRLLRRAIQADQLSSLIFYGPPGTGKTTLARIIANTTKAHFVALNAVLSGVKDIRAAIEAAKDARGMHGRRSILFIDEVHRFNKAQQDALLPWVENGTVILIGATTENPFFEVNKALVSRSRVFQLQGLKDRGLMQVAQAAIDDPERGYGKLTLNIEEDALEHLVNVANGDARALLNALELAVETTTEDESGIRRINLRVAEDSIQQRAVLYDKEGDAHFDTISAFIKSCRGSDPDAALYWLARMIYAGEDPRFVLRRLIILASEDVGLADPDALGRVIACANAFDRVGMPEGRFHLAQATLVIANAEKSNSTMGFFDALKVVKEEKDGQVPNHLKDGSRDAKSFGHGEGYLYPHAFRDHWVEQQYLPTSLQGKVFYQPSEQGYEGKIATDVARRREAQIAASEISLDEEDPAGISYGPSNHSVEQWLKRTMNDASQRLAQSRDEVFSRCEIKRHHIILDLNSPSGLLTWEAIRRAPEGGVFCRVDSGSSKVRNRSFSLPEISRPQILETNINETFANLDPDQRFDRIIGLNVLTRVEDKSSFLKTMKKWLFPHGKIVLMDNMVSKTQRLYDLSSSDGLAPELFEKWKLAEEKIYLDENNQKMQWDLQDLQTACDSCDLKNHIIYHHSTSNIDVNQEVFGRWWNGSGQRTSYRDHLARTLSDSEIDELLRWSQSRWLNAKLQWTSTSALLTATCI